MQEEICPKARQSGPFAGIRISFYDHTDESVLRDLDPTQLDRLVSVKGTIIRVSAVIPEMQIAVFQCTATISRNFEVGKTENNPTRPRSKYLVKMNCQNLLLMAM